MSKLRFTLRELLIATALLAAGFTWPFLLIFIVPVVVTAILNRVGLGSFAALAIVAAVSPLLGVLFSLYYWRYPFAPPPLLPELLDIAVVEQLSSIHGLNPEKGLQPTIEPLSVMPGISWNTATEIYATDRIIQQLELQNKRIGSKQPIPAEQLALIWHAADESGLLIEGASEYPNTKTLYGYVGIARLNNGKRIVLATLAGDQHSNDHYPYYEFVIPLENDRCAITNHQWFFFDVAGIEGATWRGVAIVSLIVLLPVTLIVGILLELWRERAARSQRAIAPAT
jgi:hypothetical protein